MHVLTSSLTNRLEQAEIDYMVSRVRAIKERPGNPMGAEIRDFGGATAFYIREMPWGTFNTVKGLRQENFEYLDEMLAFFRERDRTIFQLELLPSMATKEIMTELAGRGFYQSAFHLTLYGEAAEQEESSLEGVEIRQIDSVEEFHTYARIHCLGTGLGENGIQPVMENNVVLFGLPGWKFYLAYLEGVPAGAAVMYIKGDMASFTFAATLPEHRKRGIHSALIRKRMQDAKRAGCSLVVSQASHGSTSHNNMERCGIRLAYTRATWTQLP